MSIVRFNKKTEECSGIAMNLGRNSKFRVQTVHRAIHSASNEMKENFPSVMLESPLHNGTMQQFVMLPNLTMTFSGRTHGGKENNFEYEVKLTSENLLEIKKVLDDWIAIANGNNAHKLDAKHSFTAEELKELNKGNSSSK